MAYASQSTSKLARVVIVLALHLLSLVWLLNSPSSNYRRFLPLEKSTQVIFLQAIKKPAPLTEKPNAAHGTNTATPSHQTSKSPAKQRNTFAGIIQDQPNPLAETKIESQTEPALNRDVSAITQAIERDVRIEQQKIEAAKPPNQIAREYWQKQNNPYKDKWEALAHKIEKAGKPRGLQIETYKAWDGTQVTKVDDKCYKAPDPGRTYLHQAEARLVICPR